MGVYLYRCRFIEPKVTIRRMSSNQRVSATAFLRCAVSQTRLVHCEKRNDPVAVAVPCLGRAMLISSLHHRLGSSEHNAGGSVWHLTSASRIRQSFARDLDMASHETDLFMGELVVGRPALQVRTAVSIPLDMVSVMSLLYRAVPGSGLDRWLIAARRALPQQLQEDLDVLHGFSGRLLYYMEEPIMRFEPLREDRVGASIDDLLGFLGELDA